jgi:hypothetical protein
MTGKPDAGNPPVRFGGRGGRRFGVLSYPDQHLAAWFRLRLWAGPSEPSGKAWPAGAVGQFYGLVDGGSFRGGVLQIDTACNSRALADLFTKDADTLSG